MDIKIEALKHRNQEQLKDYYNQKLEDKYNNYPFIKSIDVKVLEPMKGTTKVTLQIKPEKGTMLYAQHEDANENKALNEAIRKMNTQIEKYKEQHYKSNHKRKVQNQKY